MLNNTAAFPYPGSFASLRGHRGTVRIQRINSDGTRLVAGQHVSARSVALDQLKQAVPAKAPRLNSQRERVAFDAGAGHRGNTHDRTNPYDILTRAAEHEAWEAGWEKTEREIHEAAQ